MLQRVGKSKAFQFLFESLIKEGERLADRSAQYNAFGIIGVEHNFNSFGDMPPKLMEEYQTCIVVIQCLVIDILLGYNYHKDEKLNVALILLSCQCMSY